LPSEPTPELRETAIEIGLHQWRLVHPRDPEALIDEHAFEVDERLPYWADIWPSARVLSEVLVRHQGNGRTALELGSGSGLVACALAVAGYQVTASDYYEASLETTARNVERNTGIRITTRLVDWRSMPPDLGRFDLVVAADVLYERPYGSVVAHAVAQTLAPAGSAIIADPGRVAFEPFLEVTQALGLHVDEGWEIPHHRDGQRHTVRIRVLRWNA
jgi:predicted nicotinamide N-methyase